MRAPDGRDYCLTDRDPLTGTGRAGNDRRGDG